MIDPKNIPAEFMRKVLEMQGMDLSKYTMGDVTELFVHCPETRGYLLCPVRDCLTRGENGERCDWFAGISEQQPHPSWSEDKKKQFMALPFEKRCQLICSHPQHRRMERIKLK